MDRKWNQFAERIPLAYRLEQDLQRQYQEIISNTAADEAIYFLPTGLDAADRIITYANSHMKERSIVSRVDGGAGPKEQVLGADFFDGIVEDQRAAVRIRRLADGIVGTDELRRIGVTRGSDLKLPDGGLLQTELRAWIQAKAWALDLISQARGRHLSFDPMTIEMEAFGGDWSYCGASYPIQIGRAMGLHDPIERRFDLMNPSEGPVLLQSTALEQNIPMPHGIRLFIWEYTDSHGPRYVAQFWEGIRGIMDPTHHAVVDLPVSAAHAVNLWGFPESRALGIDEPTRLGPLRLSVGAGGHTPIHASILMTRDRVRLEDFRHALATAEIQSP